MRYRVCVCLAFVAAGRLSADDPKVVEDIIAKVNGDIITRGEVERTRTQLEAELKQRGGRGEELAAAVKEREKDFLRDRIDQLLLVQKGKELSINIDSEVSKHMADLQLQSKVVDTDKFQEWIREQTGMTFEDFKAETRNGMLTQRVISQEVSSKVNIPRPELQKYYDDHKDEFKREERVYLREILVSTEGKDAKGIAVAEKKAKDLSARARKGEKFPEMARDNSDAATAQQGGDVGWSKKGELAKTLEDIVFAQQRNWVSDPVKMPNGFLILKVEEHQKAGLATFEEVEREIMDKVMMPRLQPKVRDYLTSLRLRAFLEIKEGYVDSGAASGKQTRWSDPAQLKPETVTKEEVAANPPRKRLLWAFPIPGGGLPPKAKN